MDPAASAPVIDPGYAFRDFPFFVYIAMEVCLGTSVLMDTRKDNGLQFIQLFLFVCFNNGSDNFQGLYMSQIELEF